MKDNKTIQDIIKVSISNVIILLSGVLVGFLLPKIVGVTDYGYYKTYTLYATYVGMFHFGISDGIYLKFGGKDYSDLDKRIFRYYSKAFSIIEIFVALLVAIVSRIVLHGEVQFIFVFLAIYLLFHNITGFYQAISQATSRFNELSSRNVIQSILISFAVIGLWIVKKCTNMTITYRTYTVLYSLIIVALALWYVSTYKDITFGESCKSKKHWQEIPVFIAIGFPLMLANLCSSLILTLDRQFVNILFDTETYAVYAFAYNMLSLITTATSAIATVLYPNLKKTDEESLTNNYCKLIRVILCLVFACLIIYFPLNIFVKWYLPKYSASLVIFKIIFPGLATSSAITIVMHNYYKTLGINFKFFIKSIVTLGVSSVANYFAYKCFGTTASISIASIVTMIFWYVYVEYYFIKEKHIHWFKNFIYMISMMTAFYLITIINNQFIALGLYLIAFIAISFAFFKKEILTITKKRI